MLLEPNPKLEEQIIQLLADKGALTAPDMQSLLQDSLKRHWSIQAVYQELRKLIRAGVIVKSGQRFSIRLGWMVELMDFSQRMYHNHLRVAATQDFLPELGRKRTWRFFDLQSLVTFTTHLGLVLFQQSRDGTIYEYGPRIWYHLAHGQNEAQFVNAVKLGKFRYYIVVRGSSFLDRSYEAYLKNVQGEIFYGKTIPGIERENDYLYVSGDFITKIVLSADLNTAIDQMCNRVKKSSDISVGAVADVFRRRTKITLTMIHDAVQAERLRKKFKRFCGV